MIEQTIWCFMTSKDAKEIALELEKIEKTGKCGNSTIARVWTLPSCGSLHTKIYFAVDQDRAHKHGLMK